jgi:hypothetical protein
VECDTSGSGFGTVLHQGTGLVAFFSRPITACHAKQVAYERKLIGLVHAIRHWRPYLWGRAFVIKIDHYNLNFCLISACPLYHNTSGQANYLDSTFRWSTSREQPMSWQMRCLTMIRSQQRPWRYRAPRSSCSTTWGGRSKKTQISVPCAQEHTTRTGTSQMGLCLLRAASTYRVLHRPSRWHVPLPMARDMKASPRLSIACALTFMCQARAL